MARSPRSGQQRCSISSDLDWTRAEMVIRKGFRRHIDSYSAFFENDRTTPTGLGGALHDRGIVNLVMVRLATDFCVAFSALDAARLGFHCSVVMIVAAPLDLDGSLAAMQAQMQDAGVSLITSGDLTF